MLADISSVDAIYIVCGRTDMRKSIDGLCAIIQEQFSMEIDHALFHVDLIAFGCSISMPDISQSNSRHVRFRTSDLFLGHR